MSYKNGDWVRVNATYQVGVIAGSTYGDELTIVSVPPFPGMPSYSVSVSAADVTLIPAQSGSPPIPFAGKLLRDNLDGGQSVADPINSQHAKNCSAVGTIGFSSRPVYSVAARPPLVLSADKIGSPPGPGDPSGGADLFHSQGQ